MLRVRLEKDLTKPYTKAKLLDKGEIIDVLCEGDSIPQTGKVWVLHTIFGAHQNRIVSVLAEDLQLATSGVVVHKMSFGVVSVGFARVVAQASGTRMRKSDTLVKCFCVAVSHEKPFWIDARLTIPHEEAQPKPDPEQPPPQPEQPPLKPVIPPTEPTFVALDRLVALLPPPPEEIMETPQVTASPFSLPYCTLDRSFSLVLPTAIPPSPLLEEDLPTF